MLAYWHTVTLGIVGVVAFLYLNCMDKYTKLSLRLGFVMTVGGAFGEIITWHVAPRANELVMAWLPGGIMHTGLALIAVELARGHMDDLVQALRRRIGIIPWDGRERRSSGD